MTAELRDRLKTACDGLYYISETDAPLTVVDEISETGPPDEVVSFDAFFAPLIAVHEGYKELQVERAKKFLELKSLLEELHDLKVWKFGGVRKAIYIVGTDQNGRTVGIRTEAVET